MPPNENGETRNPAQQPLPHRLRAHNARIWATLVLIRLAPASAHIGGSVRVLRGLPWSLSVLLTADPMPVDPASTALWPQDRSSGLHGPALPDVDFPQQGQF